MAKFDGFKLELQLKSSTPMIHFQYEQVGATLRASEVKPKFDKYLIKILDKENKGEKNEDKTLNEFCLNTQSFALDYKMRIENSLSSEPIELGNRNNYPIYYGNSGREKKGVKEIKGIFSDPKVIIICFNPELRKIIEKNIIDFFLSHNFGTMQSKGFGSFIPEDEELKIGKEPSEEVVKRVSQALKNTYDSKYCFYIAFDKYPNGDFSFENRKGLCTKLFKEINQFYGIMKSGQNFKGYSRSFLFEYMHEKYGIDNEKAWLKHNDIAPIVNKKNKKNLHGIKDNNPRYVRALLGTSELLSYVKENGKDKVSISIKSKGDTIERFSSTIFFKVVMNYVFIVARKVPEELYGKEFVFSSKKISIIMESQE